MSDRGRAWLASLEGGCKLKAYRDSAGIPTIGVGMTYWPGTRKRVEMGETIPNQAEGMALFGKILREYEATVDACTHDAITQETFDSLCSFAYNVGQKAFAGSTALRLLNQGQPLSAVCNALRRWNRAGGEVSEGLANRRECECDLIEYGAYRLQSGEIAA
jgi:lysozyme